MTAGHIYSSDFTTNHTCQNVKAVLSEKGMLDGLKANYTQDLLLESSCGCPSQRTLPAFMH